MQGLPSGHFTTIRVRCTYTQMSVHASLTSCEYRLYGNAVVIQRSCFSLFGVFFFFWLIFFNSNPRILAISSIIVFRDIHFDGDLQLRAVSLDRKRYSSYSGIGIAWYRQSSWEQLLLFQSTQQEQFRQNSLLSLPSRLKGEKKNTKVKQEGDRTKRRLNNRCNIPDSVKLDGRVSQLYFIFLLLLPPSFGFFFLFLLVLGRDERIFYTLFR